MRISLAWLREFVAIELTPEALAERCTMAGLAVESIAPAPSDTYFEFEITTNRPDCLSHYGIAREVGAILGHAPRPLAESQGSLTECAPPAAAVLRVTIEAPQACARYCARVMEDVRIAASPAAVAGRLQGMGQRLINNAADLTNYVLVEMGHPTHAFDADLLRGGVICVRYARAGETLLTLDGITRQLDVRDLVIADAERPIALAGVIGGQETAIHDGTHRIVLESAWFEPAGIRRTAKRHGLHTDASHRFERGADPEAAPVAADRIAARLQAQSGGRIRAGMIDVYPRRIERPRLRLRAEALRLLGGRLTLDEAAEILRRLGFTVSAAGTKAEQPALAVQVPSWRGDVAHSVDLVEEAARIVGYERFPPRLPAFAGGARRLPEADLERELRAKLRGHGYAETVALSFAALEECRIFAPETRAVEIRNPLSEEASFLRTSTLPAMLHLLQYNLNREGADLRLYELGKRYFRTDAPSAAHQTRPEAATAQLSAVRERRTLTLGACGQAGTVAWTSDPAERRAFDFFDLKGMVEEVLAGFIAEPEFHGLAQPGFHPGRSAAVRFQGQHLGCFGQLHPDLAATWKLKTEVYLAELDLEALYPHGPRKLHFQPPSRFPAGERDFSFLFPEAIRWEAVRRAVAELRLEALTELTPVEVFRGGALPVGTYSLLLRARFQRSDRTLRDEEIQRQAGAIVQALTSLGGQQR